MSLSMCMSDLQSVRELALELFKADDCLAEDFRGEIRSDSVSDELLKSTGCWDEAKEQMNEAMYA